MDIKLTLVKKKADSDLEELHIGNTSPIINKMKKLSDDRLLEVLAFLNLIYLNDSRKKPDTKNSKVISIKK